MPIGMPGWPEFAACTASIDKARMAFAIGARRAGSRLIAGKLLTDDSDARGPLRGASAQGQGERRAPSPAGVCRHLSTGRGKPLRERRKDGKSSPMTGDRTEAAVQRIEAALARIAQAADRAREPAAPAAPPSVT